MASIYARSTDGSNADSGATWALAKLDLAGASAIDNAGDDIWVSQSHAETTASAISIALASTNGTPGRVLCANDAAEPPTALATTGTVSTTGASSIAITGSGYIFGLTFNAGSGNNAASLNLNNSTTVGAVQIYDTCNLYVVSTSGSSGMQVGSASSQLLHKTSFKNCNIKFGNVSQSLQINHDFSWDGGAVTSGGSTPTGGVFLLGVRGGNALFSGIDLSNFSSSVNLIKQGGGVGKITFRNCKLPASWSGSLITGTITGKGLRAEMYNCDSGSTNYRLWIEDYAGSIKHETTLIKSGGASDGVTGLSWKMAASANASYPSMPLESGEMVIWNDTTGGSKTATVEILHDSATNLTDAEVWVEVQYLSASGTPLGSFIADVKTDVLASAADQTTSSATWTTTGMSNPNTQKLSVSFTPQKKGYIHAKVFLSKASKTIYVDPAITVS